jgi:SAM-dependent methyltransferase
MHDTAMQNAKRFFDTYVAHLGAVTVFEIGSQDVNGSIRSLCPQQAHYTGVDFVDGRGVDIVIKDPYVLPFGDASADVVVSSSCLEHSEMFWLLFLEVMRVLRPTGLFYLNVPSNGPFHRYPVDCWRFYPDSGQALVSWAKRNGMNPVVLESYTSNQGRDAFNDLVCVFGRDEQHQALHPNRIVNSFKDYTNGVMFPDVDTVKQLRIAPEDQHSLAWKIHRKLRQLIHGMR